VERDRREARDHLLELDKVRHKRGDEERGKQAMHHL
jgi:hypothetical protein